MIYWAPVFHFYQPRTQLPAVIKKIARESYRPLLDLFWEFHRARATFNVNGTLTGMLGDCGHEDLLDSIRRLAEAGRIELLGSGMYHPILPLVSEAEIRRQIVLNQQCNARAFGEVYHPLGFFPPELAVGASLFRALPDAGYRWVLASGIACPAPPWPIDVIHTVADVPALQVFFRDDIVSNRISFRSVDGFGFVDHLRTLAQQRSPSYVVTAMDAVRAPPAGVGTVVPRACVRPT